MHRLRYDQRNDDMRTAVIAGDATIIERVNMGVFYCMMTESDLLAAGRSRTGTTSSLHADLVLPPRPRQRALRDHPRHPRPAGRLQPPHVEGDLRALRLPGDADSDAIDEKTHGWEDIRIEAGRPDAMIVKKPGNEARGSQDRRSRRHMKLAQTEGS
jgi:hypothetical protein